MPSCLSRKESLSYTQVRNLCVPSGIQKQRPITRTATTRRFQIDANTYARLAASDTQTYNLKDGNTVTIVTTKNVVCAYDYENDLNESKRKIRIIDKK